MTIRKVIPVVLVALAIAAAPSSAHAYIRCVPKAPPAAHGGHGAPTLLLGCIFGSAFGLIGAALAKKSGQLTIEEAQAIAFTCGLGAFPVMAKFNQTPAPVVKAKF
jgi:hypothetical protein